MERAPPAKATTRPAAPAVVTSAESIRTVRPRATGGSMQQARTHYHAGVPGTIPAAQAGPRLPPGAPCSRSGAGGAATGPSGLVGGDDAVAPQALAHGPVLVPGCPDVAVLEVRPQSHPVQCRSDRVAGHRHPVQPPAGLDDVRRAVALGDIGETDLLGIGGKLRQGR